LIRSKSINSDQDDGEDLIKKGRKVWKEVCVEVFHLSSCQKGLEPTICKIPLFAARLGSTYTKQPEQDGRLFAIDEGDEKERSFQR
jgi:hypothetical protein